MTKEEKELLLKDLCARFPYKIKVKVYEVSYPVDFDIQMFAQIKNNNWYEYPKPYLRLISSMTEEEAKEIAILHDIKDILSVKVTSDYIDVIVDDGVCSTERRTIWYDEIVSSIKCFDWLNKNYFDYRDLIKKGLALEAPEGMYN